jgi:quercetin dioxygenase-like cupin family protein
VIFVVKSNINTADKLMYAVTAGPENTATETIFSGRIVLEANEGSLLLRSFASAECGAKGISTAAAVFGPGAQLPYHKHGFSEAVTILEGQATFSVEGRRYCLRPFDCIHVPTGTAHEVLNASQRESLVALSAFASASATQELVQLEFVVVDRLEGLPGPNDPERIVRSADAPGYELALGTSFYDLFAARFGAVGICGGYGRFNPGTALPCHIHDYDESITIVEGKALCQVMGRRYRLTGYDTAFVPAGRPHRFINESPKKMAMVWVYAGDEPARTIVKAGYCTGSLHWKK